MKKITRILAVILLAFLLVLPSCKKVSMKLTKENLQKISQFASTECPYHAHVEYSGTKGIFNAERTYMVEYDGSFSIGLTVEQLNVSGKKVTVYLSSPYLVSCKVVKDTKTVIYNKNYVIQSLERMDNNMLEEALALAETEMQKDIEECRYGYDIAVQNAKVAMSAFIKKIGDLKGITYEIEFVTQ